MTDDERRSGPTRMLIGGEWVDAADGRTIAVENPAQRGSVIAEVPRGSAPDVDAAVRAAASAYPDWSKRPARERGKIILRIADAIEAHAEELARSTALETGNALRPQARPEAALTADLFRYFGGIAGETKGSVLPLGEGLLSYTRREPLGVVGAIIPWNSPLMIVGMKVPAALAAGNTVVLKAAEDAPLTVLRLAELAAEHLPPGVLNVVTGYGEEAGAALTAHPGVDKLSFTGSTEVGRIIRVATAGSGKKLSLELGGKSPFIVFEDADLDSVVEGVVDAIWFNQGQVCCAGSRILVQEGIADRLVQKLRARMETLRVGSPLDKAVDIGAIVAPVQLDRIRELVAQGVSEGAACWQPSWSVPTEGLFYPPTLFTDVAPSSTVAQVEIFGPVVVQMTFRTPDEAVELANNTQYGLAASLWSENINLALDIAPRIKAGTVWINCTNMFDAASGFGGYRESGFGREGGREGMYEYLKIDREKGEERREKGDARIENGEGRSEKRDGISEGGRDAAAPSRALPPIDRTPKLYIGGKQVRPDSGYAIPLRGASGEHVADVGRGNRKDIRNAVEAAHAAAKWSAATAHLRAQVLYYLGENLAARTNEFTNRLEVGGAADASTEVEAAVQRCFAYAAWADKYDGAVHHTPHRNVTLAMPEPMGVIGLVCPDEAPLLGFLSAVLPVIAMGNRAVVVPSERWPIAATDLYQVLDTSDVPAGVVNIVTGLRRELLAPLASHDDVDAMWVFGTRGDAAEAERLSAGNMKRTWTEWTTRDWLDPEAGEGPEFLRQATQVKNIWVPYGA